MLDHFTWKLQSFEELSTTNLYHLLQLRSEVFVVEQQCAFQDMDSVDFRCHHLTAYDKGKLVAVSRIIPAGITYSFPSIGRIAVARSARGQGLGVALVLKSIQTVEKRYNPEGISIGAQLYLKIFYESFGFKQIGEPYLEDGIVHIKMHRKCPNSSVL
ncbi:GNAT family N-acetyltransferase [Dyadobacter tibetensis]|uniref:GNAT family N-acetyltransferase n=1 Tax=Dyadobacter tibetensis TaxID=1211851 RepID=UPI000471BB2E|nr:GNAT family N-acetyltransferase [Dyadobacter tibetensis]